MTSESRKKMKGRGKDRRTLILEAMRRSSAFGVIDEDSNEEVEIKFYESIVDTANDEKHRDSGMCRKILIDKIFPNFKPTNESVNFEFDKDLKPHEQAAQVMDGVAKGVIPPDIGVMFVSSIKSMIDIEEYTELKKRIEKLEGVLNGDS